ncbi:winged helix-turn-helix domain-containing protein [Haloarcula onubensis]|uniref:Winged helix-turn-helix transcriptional regulator n=1 Tax=Haloarcula onubensis TaxID=2950539 RepID=A0ABU2FJ33_9EURY|nr:winged helix-turn-helix transcriptional regulator [Halomicroarcula sp. S3CR25-11]MDS0280771.1 winged helix-turn-helix transcriptional regulator [Halomicroarcula sp. S3CR25-11]
MSEAKERTPRPKSMRHKRILDAAAEDPSASIEDLARLVPSATPDLVERVLEEYGDPAEEGDAEGHAGDDSASSDGEGTATTTSVPSDGETQSDGPPGAGADETTAIEGEPMNTADEPTEGDSDIDEPTTGANATGGAADASGTTGDGVDPDALTPTERETLRAIQANPEATQRTLAEDLGVSAATVSQRVNGIEGFEWSERAAFVAGLFDTDAVSPPSRPSGGDTPETTGESGTEAASESSVAPAEELGTAATDGSTPATTDESGTTRAGEPGTETTDGSGRATTDGAVAERLRGLEAQVEALAEQRTTQPAFEDPELVAKVVRACLDAEAISADEELEIISTLVT